jgi:hypothetical protein
MLYSRTCKKDVKTLKPLIMVGSDLESLNIRVELSKSRLELAAANGNSSIRSKVDANKNEVGDDFSYEAVKRLFFLLLFLKDTK